MLNPNHPKTVIVKVTHSCNLNCKYCCVGDVAEHHVMTAATLDNLFKKLSDNCAESTIIWHGGEPLIVGLHFYEKVIEMQSKYPYHRFKNSIQTNGTLLTNEFLDFFEANNFSIGFSLDGCKFTHNMNRPFKGDKDSFDITFKWYKEVERRGMNPGAICVINANTARYIDEIYKFAKDCNVAFKFNAQYPAGRATINVDLGLDNDEIAEAYIKLFDLWFDDKPEERVNIRMFDHFVKSIKHLTNGNNSILGYDCSWANRCQNSFIGLSTNGDLYPCGKFVGEPAFLYGNINDDRSLADILSNEIRGKFINRHDKGVEACKNCRYISMCASGCPHTAFLINNNILTKNPFCEAVLKLFKHIEKRLVDCYKGSDIFIERIDDNNGFLVYSPLRGGCFVVGEEAKQELEHYLETGEMPKNTQLSSHLTNWEYKLPIDVQRYNLDTNNKCVILLTQQCNLHCSYCYAKKSRSNETASKENIKLMIDYVLGNRPKSQKIFSFIGGGEPTLNWDLLAWSIEYIRGTQKHENVIISITTNGTLLTEERIVWLKENKVDIGLSFDILPEIQNNLRSFKNGEGSFNRINHTIGLLHKHDLFFRIRATVSHDAVELMPMMVEFVRDNYPFISHVQLEPVQDKEQNVRSYYDKFIEHFMTAYQIGKQSGIDVYNMITLSIETTKAQFCRGEFCMTPDGNIVACQRFSSERDALFHKFRYGKIENGKVQIEKDSLTEVETLFSKKLSKCETCFAKYNCAGICTAIRSDLDIEQIEEHCEFTKKLLMRLLLSYNIK